MTKALLVIDMQIDFMEGGALAIPKASRIIPTINNLIKHFPTVIASKDWHPACHKSFAIHHASKKEGEIIILDGREQILWPVHCVQGSAGADWALGLSARDILHIVYKGTDANVDSYSAFFDNAHKKSTGLHEELQKRNIKKLYLCGVATDYCVKFSALDACVLGYEVFVVKDACSGIDLEKGDSKRALEHMKKVGAHIIISQEILIG